MTEPADPRLVELHARRAIALEALDAWEAAEAAWNAATDHYIALYEALNADLTEES